jgi:hypothetical protein
MLFGYWLIEFYFQDVWLSTRKRNVGEVIFPPKKPQITLAYESIS